MSDRTRVFLSIVAVFALAGFLGACGSQVTAAPTSTTAAPTSTASTLAPLCPPPGPPTTAATLAGLLLDPPAGFTQLPDSEAPDGPISVAQLAAGSSDPTRALQVDNALGLEGGYRRSFERNADHAQLQVVVVVATCPAGAARFVGMSTPALVSFPVTDGIPGALGEQSTTTDAEGNRTQLIAAAVGRVTLTVEYFTSSSSTSMVQSLAAIAAAAVRADQAQLPS
jgi:hypothetical protein